MAAHAKLSESELNARYIAALARFSSSADWRAYLALAEEFRALDTYRDSAQLYDRCIKAASAPAYREIRETLNAKEDKTVEDYREAVRVLALIQDYSDAREFMRVCNVRANVLLYDRALALVTNSDATTDEIGQAVEIFRDIKSFRNCRELLERYDKYYCERVYAEASELMQKGHVYSEFDEAFALFSRIPQYGDAVELAAACKKKADKLRPRQRPVRQKPAKAEKPRKGKPDGTEQTERIRRPDRERPERRKDETSNGFLEVWHTLDKRYMSVCLAWFAAFIATVVASVWVSKTQIAWVKDHLNTLRGAVLVAAVLTAFFCIRCFLRMLTLSMRRKLGKSVLAFLHRLAMPLTKLTEKLMATIGIDLRRRNRLNGRDERSIVMDMDKPKKAKKRLKNELKWGEQPDNAARVRFLFIDYMILRIRQGYFLRRTMTPAEISRDIALEEDERELFAAYQKARYAGNRADGEISGEAVGRMRALNERVRSRRIREEK